ncbi:MAG: energy transducer TonB [Syntrophales bacterium]
MTLQARGFEWSIGIHALLLIAVAALQTPAVSRDKLMVIDFTIAESEAPSALEHPPLARAPVVLQKQLDAEAQRPREVVRKRNTASRPHPQEKVSLTPAEKASSPSQASNPEEALPAAPALPPEQTRETNDRVPSSLRTADAPPESNASPDGAGKTARGQGNAAAPAEGSGATQRAGFAAGANRGAAGPQGGTAAGPGPEQSKAAYLKEHFTYIRDRITGGISYPRMARKMGWCGQVRIAFVVCEDGGVNDVKVVESSGFGLLDRNAVDTVRHAAPFPPPPVKAEIRMAITYRLN